MKLFYLFFAILFSLSTTIFSQKNYEIRTIAFYNLENLFDAVDDPEKNDEASPMMGVKENREAVYLKKLNNMAKVVSEIGTMEAKNSAAIIGVAEVENRKVLEDLVNTSNLKNKKYSIIHYDSPDLRGIDVALLYQPQFFRPTHHEVFELKLWDENGFRIYTRDQLLVSGYWLR